MMIADGKIVIGNDGGVYSRPLSDPAVRPLDRPQRTLHNMQYYDARAGDARAARIGVWGGLQDNGSSFHAAAAPQMVEPAGGDGFDVDRRPAQRQQHRRRVRRRDDVLVNRRRAHFRTTSARLVSPSRRSGTDAACRTATRGRGSSRRSCRTSRTPTCGCSAASTCGSRSGLEHDSCTDTACSWQNVYDTGAGNAVTALSSANGGKIIYAAWVGGGGNPGPAFASGSPPTTAAPGTRSTWPACRTGYIAGVTVDPSNPAHAYAVFNGYSRRLIPGGGIGHVFETWNGGESGPTSRATCPTSPATRSSSTTASWRSAPIAGMFSADEGQGDATSWSRLGDGLPNAADDDVTLGPGRRHLRRRRTAAASGVFRLRSPLARRELEAGGPRGPPARRPLSPRGIGRPARASRSEVAVDRGARGPENGGAFKRAGG